MSCMVVHIPFHWQCRQTPWVERVPFCYGYCMEDRALRVGFVQRVYSGEFLSHVSSWDPHAGVSLTGMVSEDLTNLQQTNKQTSKEHFRLPAHSPSRLRGGQALAHRGWVVGLEEKLLKGTETTQEIHEGL